MKFVKRNWFLFALALCLIIGFFFCQPLKTLSDQKVLKNIVVATVLFLMALPLEPAVVGQTLRKPWASIIGSVMNFGLLPIFAWFVAFPLGDEMRLGTMVAVAAPCTLASAAVWTRKAGGNYSAAILVTLFTNGICFILTPFWVYYLTGEEFQIPLSKMIFRLFLMVVLPMIIAQVIRRFGGVSNWAKAKKPTLGILAQSGILIMVLLGAIGNGNQLLAKSEIGIDFLQVGMMFVAVNLIHQVMFVVSFFSARAVGCTLEDQIAAGFSGSQKTLMVGLWVADSLSFSILPMMVFHVSQLIADTIIAQKFAARKHENTEAKT